MKKRSKSSRANPKSRSSRKKAKTSKKKDKSKRRLQDELVQAIGLGDVERAWQAIEKGADTSQFDESGFTPLHLAVSNADIPTASRCELIEMMTMVGGADPNAVSSDGRSVLYLAAQSKSDLMTIQTLLTFVKADTADADGSHITELRVSPKVKKILTDSIKRGTTRSRFPKPTNRISKTKWSQVRRKISNVFCALEEKSILCLHKAGFTQSDGLEDCEKEAKARGGVKRSRIIGYCFYTEQDFESAMELGCINVTFWGLPKGGKRNTTRVGKMIVSAFLEAGFEVEWDGTAENRPEVWFD